MDGLDKLDIENFTCDQFLRRYPAVQYREVEIQKSEAFDFIIKDGSGEVLFGLEITQAIFQSEHNLEARKLHMRSDTTVSMSDKNWRSSCQELCKLVFQAADSPV